MVVQEDAAPGVNEAPIYQGKLILDARVAEQAIRFPIDLSLLNEGREISEQIVDVLHALSARKTKPRAIAKRHVKITWPL